MKITKIIITIFITCTLSISSILSNTSIINSDWHENEKEYQQLLEFLDLEYPKYRENEDKAQGLGKNLGNIDISKIYKAYHLDIVSFATAKNYIDFKTFILDDYNWYVPTTNDCLLMIGVSDKFEIIYAGTASEAKNDELDKELVTKVIENNFKSDEIKVLKYIKADTYTATLVYIQTDDGKEWIIPYAIRDDFTKMENGKVVEAKEFFETLNENWPIEFNSKNGVRGGAGMNKSENNNHFRNSILLLITGIGLIEGMILIRKKRKLDNN